MIFRAALFDAAHTLIDPFPPSARVYAEYGSRHGFRVTEQGLSASLAPLWWSLRAEKARVTSVSGTSEELERAWWRRLVDQAYRNSGEARGVDEACFEQIFRHYARGEAWRLYPDVRPTLEALRARGIRLAVVSNFDSRLRPVLQAHGLLDLFDTLAISSEVGWEKPHPNIYRTALEALGARPSEALMVGDDWEHDVEGPAALGIRSFWIRRPEDLRDPGSAAASRPAIASLSELLEIVK